MQAEVHFLTKKCFQDILSNNPYIDRIIPFSTDQPFDSLIKLLKKENYTCVVDLHKNARSSRVKVNLKKPGYSFDKLNFQKWLFVNTSLNFLPEKHIVDRYFDGLGGLKVNNDNQGLDFFINDRAEEQHKILIKEEKYVVFALGGAYHTKRLPAQKWIEIGRLLDGKIVLLGGEDVLEQAERIKCSLSGRCYNLCAKTSLDSSARLINGAELIIGGDSGLMHISAALKKAQIVIWGNTTPQFGMYPYYGEHKVRYENVEIDQLSCRPCSKLGHKQCPKKHFKCMALQDTERIARLATEMMKQRQA